MKVAYKVGKSRIASLTHGTSIESALELIRDGKTKTPEEIGAPWHHEDRGFMYFTPIKESFRRHYLYDKMWEGTRLEAIRAAVNYAELNQYYRFLRDNSVSELESPFDFCEIDDWIMGKIGEEELVNLLERGCPRIREIFQREEFQQARRQLAGKKGVVIELNKRVRQLGMNVEAGEVKVYFPQGLPIYYVHRIIPCGKSEEQAIDEVLQSHPREDIRKTRFRDFRKIDLMLQERRNCRVVDGNS